MVRDRFRVRGQIRTLTAEGRIQAVVLLALPFFMFLVILVLNRQYAQVLLDRPSILFVTLGFMAVGALWIRRIVHFNF
jgi:tight adherence protein B